jgi:hypothetical protein
MEGRLDTEAADFRVPIGATRSYVLSTGPIVTPMTVEVFVPVPIIVMAPISPMLVVVRTVKTRVIDHRRSNGKARSFDDNSAASLSGKALCDTGNAESSG